MSRPHYYGTDDVCYCENAAGRVYLTTPESPIPEGFQRSVARTAADKEAVWAKIAAQERRHAEQMTETEYNQRIGRMTELRSVMNQRKGSGDCSQAEKDFIRAAMEVLDRKEHAIQQFSTYGVAAMQQTEAPLPPSSNKVTVSDADTA